MLHATADGEQHSAAWGVGQMTLLGSGMGAAVDRVGVGYKGKRATRHMGSCVGWALCAGWAPNGVVGCPSTLNSLRSICAEI